MGAGRTLYLECASGISGDMVAAALLDLGEQLGMEGLEDGLRAALAPMGEKRFSLAISRRQAGAMAACDFDVVLPQDAENHDHDMAWLYGNLDEPAVGHDHDHGHAHDHADHDHASGHHHEHRTVSEALHVVDQAKLSPRACHTAHRVFEVLGEAEAKAHGTVPQEVRLHEVGAIDSIVDVTSVAWLLDALDVDDVVVSPLAEGHGRVRTQHGVLPIPVPAVANIVAASGLVLERMGRSGELVTPTGAAIAAAVRTRDDLPARYRVLGVGVGAGKRAYDPPSTLRAMMLEPVGEKDLGKKPGNDKIEPSRLDASRTPDDLLHPDLWKLECEVDDCTGEALGHVLGRLFALGAREAHFLPCLMKKGRPAYQVEVLCDEPAIPALEQALFEDTTTIGVRRSPLWRTALPREKVSLSTPYGEVDAKRVTLPGGASRTYPEYESVAAASATTGVSFQDVYRAAAAAATSA